MKLSTEDCQAYLHVLKEELIPAMGCTEPIAIAFAAARALELLGEPAFSAHVEASGNMIKNVKSVIVPNTDGMKGIEAACIAGMVAGDAGKKLQVISRVTDQQKREIKRLSENPGFCTVSLSPSDIPLYLAVTLTSAHHTACVVIAQSHLNIIQEVLDGNILKQVQPEPADSTTGGNALDFMSVEGIYEYAQTVNPEEVRDLIETQLAYNLAIAEEGLAHDWGANIGKVLLKQDPHNVRQRAKAYAAAGSDARMSGCELPVVINSGSGNQGIELEIKREGELKKGQNAPAPFGRYKNVFLSEKELAELQEELPGKWEYYIDRLSGYIASSGKNYKNHAATIRRWAADDKAKGKPKKGIPDYSYKEGESL